MTLWSSISIIAGVVWLLNMYDFYLFKKNNCASENTVKIFKAKLHELQIGFTATLPVVITFSVVLISGLVLHNNSGKLPSLFDLILALVLFILSGLAQIKVTHMNYKEDVDTECFSTPSQFEDF